MQRLVQLVLPLGAPCLGDHVGTLAVAVDLSDGEKSPVRAAIPVVSRGSTVLTSGVTLSVAV